MSRFDDIDQREKLLIRFLIFEYLVATPLLIWAAAHYGWLDAAALANCTVNGCY